MPPCMLCLRAKQREGFFLYARLLPRWRLFSCFFYCSFLFGGLGLVAHNLQFKRFVCQQFLILFCGLRRSGTRFRIWAIYVPKISHFFWRIEEVWHTISNLSDLCARNFSFFPSKIFGGRAGLAHKTQKSRFVCQDWPSPVRETAPGWDTKPEKADLCAKIDLCPSERQRPTGTQNPKLPICVPKLTDREARNSATENRL